MKKFLIAVVGTFAVIGAVIVGLIVTGIIDKKKDAADEEEECDPQSKKIFKWFNKESRTDPVVDVEVKGFSM